MDLSNQGHTVWRLANKVFPNPTVPGAPTAVGGGGLAAEDAAPLAPRKELSAGAEEPAAH